VRRETRPCNRKENDNSLYIQSLFVRGSDQNEKETTISQKKHFFLGKKRLLINL